MDSDQKLPRISSVNIRNDVQPADSVETQEKYLKLINDLAKTRAQNAVLKRAVIQEKATVEKLQSGLKQKDHDLRKTIQDFDSLKFHNERLVRRVESLQGELRHKAGYTSWFGSTQHRREAEKLQQTMDLLQTDLQNKIRQNGELQAQLDELNLLHRESLENSAKDKRKLNEQIRDMKQEMVGQMSSYEDQLSHLKARLAELERRPSRTSNDPPSNERTDAAMAVEADRLKERINELERQLADAQRANGDHHVLELEDRLRKLEGELKHERDLHRQVRSELERFSFEKQQAQSKLDEELGNQADLRQTIEKLEAEGTILRERLTERDLQVKDLESKVPLPKSVMEGAAQTDPIPAPVPSVQSHTPQTVIELHLPKGWILNGDEELKREDALRKLYESEITSLKSRVRQSK